MTRSNSFSSRFCVRVVSSTAIALLASAGCGEAPAKPAPTSQPRETVSVRIAPIVREPIDDLVDFVGTLYGEDESLVAAKVAGRIVETRADLGDRVDDGALLTTIDPTDAKLEVERREMALRQALASIGLSAVPDDSFDVTTIATVRRAAVQSDNTKARLERAKQLFNQAQPLISPQDFADIETQQAVAQQDYDVAILEAKSAIALARSRASELAVAQQQLADTNILAPRTSSTTQPSASGRWAVAERRVSVGEYVAPGSIVYRLITDQPIKLKASIPERFVGRIAKGQAVALWVDASDRPVAGEIARVSPAVDVASRTFAIEMIFPNLDRALKPGGFGRGTIAVGKRTDVSTIHPAALYSFAGLDKVFTVRDGKAVMNTVKVVSKDAQRVIVQGDLNGSSDAIVSNLARLANGDPIKIDATPASQSAK